jgi:adenosine/AMP kinase
MLEIDKKMDLIHRFYWLIQEGYPINCCKDVLPVVEVKQLTDFFLVLY